jgi:hypothetical protein
VLRALEHGVESSKVVVTSRRFSALGEIPFDHNMIQDLTMEHNNGGNATRYTSMYKRDFENISYSKGKIVLYRMRGVGKHTNVKWDENGNPIPHILTNYKSGTLQCCPSERGS